MPDQPDLLDIAIEQAISTPESSELLRKSRRFEELRQSPAWAELRESVSRSRERVMLGVAKRLLGGVDPVSIRDEIIYARGYANGAQDLVDYPGEVEAQLEKMIEKSYDRLKNELLEATEEESPYA